MSMTQDEMKQAVARAALEHVVPNTIIGIGTGSTANFFIDALAEMKDQIKGTVASSEASAERLRGHGIEVLDLNEVDHISVYVDGADETNRQRHLIKGGGGALTREKIVAAVADKFVCIVDETKVVEKMGAFPLPVEVIPMSRAYVARELAKLGGEPVYREGFVTDNGCDILDIRGLQLAESEVVPLEEKLNHITGVVTNGLFAMRPADLVLVGTPNGVEQF